MKAPDWWWRDRPTLPARLLSPLGAVYGAVTATRMARSGRRLGVPVLCVGNLVAGGAGKTPVALALAALLQARSCKPAFVSRGYGGEASRLRGACLRVDPGRHASAEVGDEPLLLAAAAPTFVGADRRVAAEAAREAGADCVILDDGLQNPALRKDWTLAVFDGATGLGNGLCLPAGPLRAPPGRQWPLVSAACVVGSGTAGDRVAAAAAGLGKPVFPAALVPGPAATEALRGHRLLAFAGIGRPAKFTATLRDAGLDVVGTRAFADHHRYGADEVATLARDARAAGALLVTTEKDRVRLPADAPVHVVPVTLAFEQPDAVAAAVAAALRSA